MLWVSPYFIHKLKDFLREFVKVYLLYFCIPSGIYKGLLLLLYWFWLNLGSEKCDCTINLKQWMNLWYASCLFQFRIKNLISICSLWVTIIHNPSNNNTYSSISRCKVKCLKYRTSPLAVSLNPLIKPWIIISSVT